MRANIVNPPFDRRLGNRNKKKSGKDQRNLPETDAAYHRQIAAQPDDAFAHMLGGRDTLDIRCKVHALLLVVQVGALRNEKPILDWIMEGREFMNVDMIDVLTPTDRRGGPQFPLKVELAQVELD